MTRPPLVAVMGVSGCGKTTLGAALAARLGVPFQEGDDLHPPDNVAKMAAGTPLTDADRAPWLDRVADWLAKHRETGGVIACSALKRVYRDRLRAAAPGLAFIFPDPGEALVRARLTARQGHYMPVSLLDSQLATLERPCDDERALTLQGAPDLEAALTSAADWLDVTV